MPNNWIIKYEISKNTRNGLILEKPKTRNKFCDKNFFIYSTDLFNSLPKDIRNDNNYKSFF